MKTVEVKPNIPSMFRYIAHVYQTDAEMARMLFFGGWPQLTEAHFDAVIIGNYKVVAGGEGVNFPEEVTQWN